MLIALQSENALKKFWTPLSKFPGLALLFSSWDSGGTLWNASSILLANIKASSRCIFECHVHKNTRGFLVLSGRVLCFPKGKQRILKACSAHYTTAAHQKHKYGFNLPPRNDYIMYRTGQNNFLLRNFTNCWTLLPWVTVAHAGKAQL